MEEQQKDGWDMKNGGTQEKGWDMVGDGVREGRMGWVGDGGAQKGGLGWLRWMMNEENKDGWNMVGNRRARAGRKECT